VVDASRVMKAFYTLTIMKIENIKIHRQVTAEHQKVLLLYLRDETQIPFKQWAILRKSVRLLGHGTLFLEGVAKYV